ncbi:EamA/RhaT family transporter, partial [Thioclava sp. BHET1]
IMTGSMAAFVLNDACMKIATQTLPTFPAAALRGCITVAMLCLISHLRGGIRLRFSRRQGGLITLRCVAEAVSTACFLLALKHMPLANITAVLQALPLAVTLGAAVVFGERIGWRRAVAVMIGLIGVLVIIRPGSSGFSGWSLLALA